MTNDLLYQVALTCVPQIGPVQAKSLLHHYGSAEAVFRARKKELEKLDGIGPVRAESLKSFSQFDRCEAELVFMEKFRIKAIGINSYEYPKRLRHCYDSPLLLYYRGNADLNAEKIISIVGTRNLTEYGKQTCEQLVTGLQAEKVLVLSGLALGIDTIAHRTALKCGLPTVGVLGHGLDLIYPYSNRGLARQMSEAGGLLTEFPSETKPDKQNFPRRNRIVAGMSDCIIVIETGNRGGSMITAELGNNYNRDVFAIPGRITDSRSEGCHYLIRSNKAALVSNASDILEAMNWKPVQKPALLQRSLFIELSEEERKLTEILQQEETVQIDTLYFKSGLSSSAVAAALLSLEMQGLVQSLPGKQFRLA